MPLDIDAPWSMAPAPTSAGGFNTALPLVACASAVCDMWRHVMAGTQCSPQPRWG